MFCPYIAACWELAKCDVTATFGLMVKFQWMHPTQEPVSMVHEWLPQSPFWRGPSCQLETPTYSTYKGSSKSSTIEQKGPLYTPEESLEEYLQVSHPGYSNLTRHHEHYPQEPWRTRWPRKSNAEQSAPTIACDTRCASRQLVTTANWRYDVSQDWLWDACLLASVRWGTHKTSQCGHASLWRWRPWCGPSQGEGFSCEWICCKEDPHYCIRQSTRNSLEQDQVQRALWNSSRSCHKISLNQPWSRNLEIPWGFLARDVLCGLNCCLCHVRKHKLKALWKRKVWYETAQRTLHQKPSAKSGNGNLHGTESTTRVTQTSCSGRNSAICARNMGAHVLRTTSECPRYENGKKNLIPIQPRKAQRN